MREGSPVPGVELYDNEDGKFFFSVEPVHERYFYTQIGTEDWK